MTPVLTIGLPVYNGETYLPAALAATQEQDLEDIEIVVSDNGSTDATEAICRAAAASDRRIRYLRSEVNKGGAWNYMNVARAARAPFFTWLAADDVKLPGFASTCVEALVDAGPSVVMACSRTQVMDQDGVVFEDLNDLHMGLDAPRAPDRLRNLYRSQASHVVYSVVRVDALRRTRGILPMVGDDMVLNTELLCLGSMVLVDEQLFRIRRHREQLSRQGHQQVKWHAPDGAVRFAFPQTRLDAELARAVLRSPLPGVQKAESLMHVARWWALPRWRGVARDVVTAAGFTSP